MEQIAHPNFEVGQRVRVKEQGYSSVVPPMELQGKRGTIEGMAGMVAREGSNPKQWVHRYVVVIDNGVDPSNVIPGDWLEAEAGEMV